MRRLRNDLPYTFRPPIPGGWVRPLGLAINRTFELRRKYRVTRIQDEGFGKVREIHDGGQPLLLAPNHSDHSDPHVLMELAARHGMRAMFMAAREVFEVSPVAGWALQRMGCFSVNRDGPDLSAIKTAIGMLEAGENPLVIFPEGEIYHHHRRLDPLNEGVASILLKVAARRDAWLVPVALKFFHDPSVETTFCQRLSKLEDRIGWTPRPALGVDARIQRLANGILALKETEYLGKASPGSIAERLELLCGSLLTLVEERYPKSPKAVTPPERVRALRFQIRRRLLDAGNPPDSVESGMLLDDLDRVFTALQAHSYVGDYLPENPTTDRRAETLMKLEEDLFGFPTYPVSRTAHVVAGEPIPVHELLRRGELPGKGGEIPLTRMVEQQLTSLLGEK